jgi:SnoaL-like polyketide cyclase.
MGEIIMLPIDVVKKTMESIETGDMETTGIYLSEGLVSTGMAPEPLGKKQYLEIMTGLLDAIPNWSYNTIDINERGSVVRARVRISGRNTGELNFPLIGIRKVKPTGMRFALTEERIEFTVRDNKIHSIKIDSSPNGTLSQILRKLGVEMPEKVAV